MAVHSEDCTKAGDKFKLTKDAIENYGEQYANKIFTVKQWYNHYCKTQDMQNDEHGHPGFDEAAGSRLYASQLPFDVYIWETIKLL